MRIPSQKEYCHDRLGEDFQSALSEYDTQRRLTVLLDDFLSGYSLQGKRVLEVGSGLGHFAARLQERGAHVTATDIGERLLAHVRATVGCECKVADAMFLEETFGRSCFDVVLSSECIEHTPDPDACLRQFAAVLRPAGLLALSTPNKLWWPVVRAASALKLRPFDGLENFNSFGRIRSVLDDSGVTVVREKGLHLFPFQLPFHGVSTWCDEHLQVARPLMINLCVLGRKRG